MTKLAQRRHDSLVNFVHNVFFWILKMEVKDKLWILKVKILLDMATYRCRVDILNDKEDDVQEPLKVFNEQVTRMVADLKVRRGFEKIFVEIDFKDGALSVRIQDWGIIVCPMELRGYVSDMGIESDIVGDFDRGDWTSRQVRDGEFAQSAKDILLNDSVYGEIARILLERIKN